jgi:cytochrome b6-f complex iron-sulfur subunit
MSSKPALAMNAMPSDDKPLSRRGFMDLFVKASLAGSALFGLGALGRYISFQVEGGHPSTVDLGPASDYPAGSRIPTPEIPAIVINTEQGYKALSLVCPHLGCTANVTSDGFACPCHGSQFTPDGSLRNGPASHPLTNLRVEVNADGHLIVYTG